MKNFKQLPLATAVLGALVAVPAYAEITTPTQELETITVTADRQGAKVKTNVVTTRTKDESVETDLRGLLKNEPAISIGGGHGTSQFIYLRGMGQNSVDVKVDNAYTDSQIHYHQGRHMLDPAMVKIVSVQKGAGSASAGIGQTNGAIVAKTLDAQDLLKNSDSNIGAKVGVGASTNHAHNYNFSVFGKGDTLDFLVSANRVKESNYEAGKGYKNAIDNGNRVPYSALDKHSYLIKLGANVGENHRFVLSHLQEQHHGIRTVREEFAAVADPEDRLSLKRQSPQDRKMTVRHTNLEWTGKDLGFAESANANIYRLIHGRWSADDSKNGYAGAGKNPVGEATKITVETIGANVNFDSRILPNVLLKYGVNYRHQETKTHAIFDKTLRNQKKQDVGVYVEAITDIADQLALTTGLRYDHFRFTAMDGKKRSDGAFNPSIGLIYEPTQNLSFSASHNYATRSPRMFDAIMSHGNRGVVSISDKTKAEQARNTEIGFNYNDGMFALEGSYFWQTIKDALGTGDKHNTTGSEIINGGTIKNKGYELAASFRHEGLTARLAVAQSKPRFHQNHAVDKDNKPKNLLSANPDYASVIGRTWTASLSYRFAKPNLEIGVHHSKVESVKKEDNFFLMGGATKPAVAGKKGYNVTDITANWKPFNNDKMNVNLAVNNITNKLYTPHSGRQLPAGGREYRLGVNYTF